MNNNDSERLSPRAKKILRQIKKGTYVYPQEVYNKGFTDCGIIYDFNKKGYISFEFNCRTTIINGIYPYYINFKILDNGDAMLSKINKDLLFSLMSIVTFFITLISLIKK